MIRLVEPRNKPFIHIGWFRKKICFPEMPENILDYFDSSFLKNIEGYDIDLFMKNNYHIMITFLNKTDRKYKRIVISNINYGKCLFGDDIKDNGSVSYEDDKCKFSWPINDFKNWPEEIKNFTLKFIEALENAYYKCKADNDAKEEKEAAYNKVLKDEELKGVRAFFGEIVE